jgi:hypothetical protein
MFSVGFCAGVRIFRMLQAKSNQQIRGLRSAHLAFDHRVDLLRELRKAGWIVVEVWVAGPGNRGHARRRYSAAQAYCTESGREALELIGG